MVIDIDEDSKGNIWIGTYGKGISKLDPVTEKFTNYSSTNKDSIKLSSDDVTCLIVDNEDVIWIGNWFGYTRITMEEDFENVREILSVPIDNIVNLDEDVEIKQIYQDKEGQIWMGTNFNIIRLINPYASKDQIRYEIFPCKTMTIYEYEDGLLLGGDSISAIQKQAKGNYQLNTLYPASSLALIYRNQKIWSGNRNGITCLQYNPEKGWQEQYHINKENSGESITSNIVTSIFKDETGQIWVGTRGGGVFTIDLNPKKFYHYYNTESEGSIGSNFIQCVFEDHNQNLWIGTEDNGISYLSNDNPDAYANGFKHIVVNENINENRAYCIEEIMTPGSNQHESVIWIGTSFPTHLVAINPENFKLKELPEFVDDMGFVFALENQGDSILWVGTYGEGLWKLSIDKDGNIKSYLHLTPEKESETQISSYIIRDLFLDRDNNLWITTDKGLNRIQRSELHKSDPVFELYKKGEGLQNLNHDYLLQLYQAVNGRIWMGSMGGGLIAYTENERTGDYHFFTLTESDGLPNNSVKSILEDDRGYLWLATNKGLTRYNPFDGDIINYDVVDGLQDNEYSEICAFKRSNGQLVFGGINGFNVFNPNQIYRDTLTPKLFLTDFYISNEKVEPGQVVNGKVILEKSIEYMEEIKLRYNQNSFSIGFLGLYYKAPQKNKYKYMLEGFDEDWYNASASYRIAKYTNIPAGEYIFKVIGSNSDNIWAKKPVSIKLIIRPPFYLSKLAFVIYVIILFASSYITYRIIRIITKRKKELLIAEMERKKVEEIAQIKLRFFTNISHEFRTPLTLITTPLEKLITKNSELSDEERLSKYSIIKQNADIMLRLINQLMDFRRLDQEKMKLNAEASELNQFVQKICNSFESWADQKNISFHFDTTNKEIKLWFDHDKLEKVVYNLLSNAFKFTPKNGSVNVEIEDSDQNNKVTIYVSDTGIGIDTNEQLHIFERYYQPDRKNKQSFGGTGIGLALSKGLIELHKGSIGVTSEQGKGTTFSVVLNKGQDWLQDESLIKEEVQEIPIQVQDKPDELHVHMETEMDIEIKQGHYKILLVEDNVDLRKVVADIFRNEFEVLEADDGEQGYKKCKESHPDLVISDIMMPNMNGIELCNKIKSEEEISHIPILLLTAKDTEESQIEGFETGADAYMPKPFSTELLRARAAALIINHENLRKKFQKEIEINPMIIANSPADSKFLDHILAIIEENLSDSEFSVERLAELYGVSRIYLNRKIKALTGETSNQFLRNIRLKHAAELLNQNVLTVSEVTWQVGYNDLRTFRTRFKEKFGMSPSVYSKNSLNNSRTEDI
ncbi:Sensor histidine kinase RcsC [subsurface metagenome]